MTDSGAAPPSVAVGSPEADRSPEAAPPSTVRLAVLYCASYLALGALVPYLALALGDVGIWGTALALCMGALPLGRLLAGPLWGVAADALQAPARVLRVAAVLTPLPVVGLMVALSTGHKPGVLLACVAYAVFVAPIGPMIDALALSALARGPRSADSYGAVRRWGSLGYLLGSGIGGMALARLGLSPLWLVLLGTVLVALASIGVAEHGGRTRQPLRPALQQLLRSRAMAGLFVAGALHFSIHVGTASFLSVHMAATGLDTGWTGTALAAGVLVEIAVMSVGRQLLARVGARTLLLGALGLAVFRWAGMATAQTGAAMVALQASHGLTFGAFWLASVALVDRSAPTELRASAQALLSAAVAGAGALLGMVGGSAIVSQWDTWVLFRVGIGVGIVATLVAALTVPRRAR